MTTKFIVTAFLFTAWSFIRPADVSAQTTKTAAHQVVMEMINDDPKAWESALNNIENLSEAFGTGTVTVELVAHGGGLKMLEKKNNLLTQRMRELNGKGTKFSACENTMKRKNVKKAELFDFAETVDSGVAEVVRKQEAGWSYLKLGT